MKKSNLPIVIFELTDACNQSCKFCYNHWKSDVSASAAKPDFKSAKSVLIELFRQADVHSISFSGGEPMLMPRIHDLVLKARFHKSAVNILTNGTLLRDDDIAIFCELGVSKIQIPLLSADSHLHDSITGVEGSWNKCVEALRKVHQANPSMATSVLILNGENISTLEETLKLYQSLEVTSVLVNRFNIGGAGLRHRQEMNLTFDQLQAAFKLINEFAADSRISFFSGVCTPMCILDPNAYPNIHFSFCSTDLSARPLTINYKGDLRFCNHSPKVLGNIFQTSLAEILDSTENTKYYETVPEYCRKCDKFTICRGGCRAASEQLDGTFSLVDPLVRENIVS